VLTPAEGGDGREMPRVAVHSSGKFRKLANAENAVVIVDGLRPRFYLFALKRERV